MARTQKRLLHLLKISASGMGSRPYHSLLMALTHKLYVHNPTHYQVTQAVIILILFLALSLAHTITHTKLACFTSLTLTLITWPT
uniref:Uncharacterized protein n=1 Tax=Rhizophora mucronata TaxID=61149 RepID=A0A2P2NHZ2_RHIMU